jgi:hypothetical protein
MNLKRTATIVVGGAAIGAWLAGAATSNHSIPATTITPTPPIDLRGAELANEIARLQERLRPTSRPRQPGRNLFAFRARAARSAPAALALAAPPVMAPPLPLPPSAPMLKLAGIAEDDSPDGPVRTAIISGEGQLFLVKEGDEVTPRYRVGKISADGVELIDSGDNTLRRLALR